MPEARTGKCLQAGRFTGIAYDRAKPGNEENHGFPNCTAKEKSQKQERENACKQAGLPDLRKTERKEKK